MTKRQHGMIDIVVVILIATILFLWFYGQAHAESAVDSSYGHIDTTKTIDSVIVSVQNQPYTIVIINMGDSICIRSNIPPPDTSLYAIRLYGTYQDLQRYAKRPHWKYFRIVPLFDRESWYWLASCKWCGYRGTIDSQGNLF